MYNEKVKITRDLMGSAVYDLIVGKYPKSTQMVLEGKYEELKDYCPEQYRRIESLTYSRDNRSKAKFAFDVAIAWVMEDFIAMLVKSYTGVKLTLGGTDSNRLFSSRGSVTSAADFTIHGIMKKKIDVEFITDYYGYCSKVGSFVLRGNKLRNLLRRAESKPVMILSLDVKNKTFFLQDVRDLKSRDIVKWGKESKQVDIDFPVYKLNKNNLNKAFSDIGR